MQAKTNKKQKIIITTIERCTVVDNNYYYNNINNINNVVKEYNFLQGMSKKMDLKVFFHENFDKKEN